MKDAQGLSRFEALLHQDAGALCELEIVRADGGPVDALPDLEAWRAW